MNNNIVIIGASGHGKVISDIVKKSGDIVKGFLDDNKSSMKYFAGSPVLGQIKDYRKYLECEFVVAIGNPTIRKNITEELEDVRWYTAIHPSAEIADIEVIIEEGTVIMANAVINPGTKIGKHCIINSSAVVEHDNNIRDFAHISVGAKLAGTVSVGKSTWVGIGVSVSNNISICDDCIIGAGAVVVKDIKEPGIYVGIPAERLNKTKK